jgi:hypothetical protein
MLIEAAGVAWIAAFALFLFEYGGVAVSIPT